MKKNFFYQLVQLFLFFCFLSLPVFAQGFNFGKTEIPFKLNISTKESNNYPGSKTEIVIRIDFPENHYLYRDKTSVSFSKTKGLSFGNPVFPKPLKMLDKFSSKDKEIYNKSLSVTIPVEFLKNVEYGKKEIVAKVKFQGCSDSICFLPQEKELRTSLEIVKKK